MTKFMNIYALKQSTDDEVLYFFAFGSEKLPFLLPGEKTVPEVNERS